MDFIKLLTSIDIFDKIILETSMEKASVGASCVAK